MVLLCREAGMIPWSARQVYREAQAPVQASLRDDAEWVEIEQAVLRALIPYPEAKAAVAQEIERISPLTEDSS